MSNKRFIWRREVDILEKNEINFHGLYNDATGMKRINKISIVEIHEFGTKEMTKLTTSIWQ